MGFLEMIGFALYHAIKEEAEEEQRIQRLNDKLNEAESDFSSFCSIWGFSSIIYIPDYTCVDLGKEFVNEEIEKMEEFKEKMRKFVSLGGKPSLLNDVDEIDDYIQKLEYLQAAGFLDEQEEYLEYDFNYLIDAIEEKKELAEKIEEFELYGGDPDLITDTDDIDDYLEKIQYLFENGLVHRQDEFLEYDYDDMVEMIKAECEDGESDDGWDESEAENDDDIYSAFEKRVLSRIPELQVPSLRYPLENANYLFGDNLNYYLHWVAEYENGTLDVFTMLQIVELLYTALIDQMKRNRITIHEIYMVCDIIEDILCPLDDFLSHFNRFADIYYITLVIHAECDVFRGFYFDAIEKFKNVYWEWKVDPDDMNYSAVLNRAAISIISLYNLLDMNDEALSLASFLHLEEYGILEDSPLIAKTVMGLSPVNFNQEKPKCLLSDCNILDCLGLELMLEKEHDSVMVAFEGSSVVINEHFPITLTGDRDLIRLTMTNE